MSDRLDDFAPTLAAARDRIDAIRPADYARSRNHLGGAVTRLSPYLVHGIVGPAEVLATVAARHALPLQHKLVQELAWRAFFHHVARHRGEAILQSLHEGPRPEPDYLPGLPDDIRQARTGVPVVDQAVRALYATGWLHNHARMWLASYVVHLRGVHWRAGADWLIAHLLDGDRASNHLSWQWVAGTGSHKPYLFNAENVARYCGGSHPAWASPGSVVDTGYDTLEQWARGTRPLPPPRPRPEEEGEAEPALLHRPPAGCDAPPAARLPPEAFAGRQVLLVHPWALAEPPPPAPAAPGGGVLRLGVWPAEHFARWPWTVRRWRFAAQRLAAVAPQVVWADALALRTLLARAARVSTADHPELPAGWPQAWRQRPPPWLPEPERACNSFSQFWRRATTGLTRLDELPNWPGPRQAGLF